MEGRTADNDRAAEVVMRKIQTASKMTEVFRARGLTSVYDREVSVLMSAMERVGLCAGENDGELIVFNSDDPESAFPAALRDIVTMTGERLKTETQDSDVKKWRFLLELTASKCVNEDENVRINGDGSEIQSKANDRDTFAVSKSEEQQETDTPAESGEPKNESEADAFNFSYRKGHRFVGDDPELNSYSNTNRQENVDDEFGDDSSDDEEEFEVDPDEDQGELSQWANLFSDSEEQTDRTPQNQKEPITNQRSAYTPETPKPQTVGWVPPANRGPKQETKPVKGWIPTPAPKAERKPVQAPSQVSSANAPARTPTKIGLGGTKQTEQPDRQTGRTKEYSQQAATGRFDDRRHDYEGYDMQFDVDSTSRPARNTKKSNQNRQVPAQTIPTGNQASMKQTRQSKPAGEPEYYRVTVVESYSRSYLVRAGSDRAAVDAVRSMWDQMNRKNEQGKSGVFGKKDFSGVSVVALPQNEEDEQG